LEEAEDEMVYDHENSMTAPERGSDGKVRGVIHDLKADIETMRALINTEGPTAEEARGQVDSISFPYLRYTRGQLQPVVF
jgi:3'5'-cyclic nucleotide phosphodiesterase